MPIIHLTDVSVRSLEPGTYLDSKTPAFGIRVGKNRRTWIVLKEPNRTKVRLGHYPALSLSDARKIALVTLGSPLQAKAPSVTFGTVLPLYIAANYKQARPRTRHEANRLLTQHFLPVFSNRAVAEITDDDIKRQLDTLSRVPSEQLHAFRALRTMLRWCTRPPHRYLKHSPLEGYAPPSQDKKGDRVLTDKELVKIWRACEGQFGAMVRLLILWGTRNGETARIKRSWIDDGLLTIPGKFTKNGRAHAIVLLPMAKMILAEQPNDGDYFFTGNRGSDSHFNDGSWGKSKIELDKASGVTNWQVRDIRRTFRSNMAKLRVSREICEILLNHVTGDNKNDLDEIYNRYDYLTEKRLALVLWEKRLKTIFNAPT